MSLSATPVVAHRLTTEALKDPKIIQANPQLWEKAALEQFSWVYQLIEQAYKSFVQSCYDEKMSAYEEEHFSLVKKYVTSVVQESPDENILEEISDCWQKLALYTTKKAEEEGAVFDEQIGWTFVGILHSIHLSIAHLEAGLLTYSENDIKTTQKISATLTKLFQPFQEKYLSAEAENPCKCDCSPCEQNDIQ